MLIHQLPAGHLITMIDISHVSTEEFQNSWLQGIFHHSNFPPLLGGQRLNLSFTFLHNCSYHSPSPYLYVTPSQFQFFKSEVWAHVLLVQQHCRICIYFPGL